MKIKDKMSSQESVSGLHSVGSRPRVTLVLTLTIDDAHRALMLIASIRAHELCERKRIHELLVVVPDAHVFALDILKQVNHCLAISIVEESSLFDGMIQSTWPKYALQMALKLVVAQRVTTKYYITLDADNIVVGPLDLTELFPGGKGVFAAEPRSIHPHWWDGSSQVLGLNEDASPDAMFGVTPAIISTMGALVTTALIRERFKNSNWGQVWIESWGFRMWWSEYTLYRLALDKRDIFWELHTPSTTEPLCNAIWFQEELPWNSRSAFENKSCIFSLVQSSAGLAPSAIAGDISAQLPRF